MGKRRTFSVVRLFLIDPLLLVLVVSPFASALTIQNIRTWYWTGSSNIASIVIGNVDGDAQTEIVTGGYTMMNQAIPLSCVLGQIERHLFALKSYIGDFGYLIWMNLFYQRHYLL